MNLEWLGWNSFFSKNLSSPLPVELTVGRVAVEHKDTYILYTEYGYSWNAGDSTVDGK